MFKIFVGGFPLQISEMGLAKLIAPHGNLATLKIVRDRKTGWCKGYAFVEMETLLDAENVMAALNGTMLEGRMLTVSLHTDQPPAWTPRGSYLPPSSSEKGSLPAQRSVKRPRRHSL